MSKNYTIRRKPKHQNPESTISRQAMSVDLKALLLRSVSSTETLYCTKRVSVGKKCFGIALQICGKMLTVTNVQQVHKKKPFGKRVVRRYQQLLKRIERRKLSKVELPEDLHELRKHEVSPQKDQETQTPHVEFASKMTETEKKEFLTRHQQTIGRGYRKISTQTDLESISEANQTDYLMVGCSTQTEERSLATASSQANVELWSSHAQTDPLVVTALNGKMVPTENETIIFLLNEISEVILNQNSLINNNAVLLDQITEMSMLNRVSNNQDAEIKNRRHLKHLKKRARLKRSLKRIVYIYKTRPPPEMSHKFVQTVFKLDGYNKSTQTELDVYNAARKSKFSQLFKL